MGRKKTSKNSPVVLGVIVGAVAIAVVSPKSSNPKDPDPVSVETTSISASDLLSTETLTETILYVEQEATEQSTLPPATSQSNSGLEDIQNETTDTTESSTGIDFVSWPQTIGRNETGIVKIQGEPNTDYSITVRYKSGPASASGLETKTSDKDGYVSWSWKIGGKTSTGTFSITVAGGGQSETVKFTISE